MAATTMFCIPVVVLFFVAQRYFLKGISFSGLKG
jgi:ABC-type maltose transport system permease subunit